MLILIIFPSSIEPYDAYINISVAFSVIYAAFGSCNGGLHGNLDDQTVEMFYQPHFFMIPFKLIKI